MRSDAVGHNGIEALWSRTDNSRRFPTRPKANSKHGHIHMHRQWAREHDRRIRRIAYPGSIKRYHYGELGKKYCLIWDVSADTAGFTPVQTPSKRMIEIAFEGVPNLDELATVADQCRGALVRVRYSVDEEFVKTVDRQAIKQILGAAAEVKIEGEVLTIQRQRCAGISTLTAVEERFLKWCGFTNALKAGLSARLSMLQTMAPEDIRRTPGHRKVTWRYVRWGRSARQ